MRGRAAPNKHRSSSIGGLVLGVIARPPLPLLKIAGRLHWRALNQSLLFVPTIGQKVALTLDDGPHPDTTCGVLETLAGHKAKATFFLHGCRARAHGNLVDAIVKAGHEIGNHTWEDTPSTKLPAEAFRASLARTHEQLIHGGHGSDRAVHYFRPAGGWTSCEMVSYARCAFGYQTVIGSLYPFDTRVRRDEWVIDAVVGRVFPGAIIVMHEGAGRGRLSMRLERILERLRPDYEITTVSELLSEATPVAGG